MTKVLLTGAAGYIADQILPTFRERYETVLVDVSRYEPPEARSSTTS